MKIYKLLLFYPIFFVFQVWGEGFLVPGRVNLDREDKFFKISPGVLTGLSGSVVETSRLITRTTGESALDKPESYDLKELGFDDTYTSLGIGFENHGKLFSFIFNLQYTKPTVDATAVRDYYIGVENVSYDGKDYEYMFIPEGQQYHAEMDVFLIEIAGRYTPFSIMPTDYSVFTPWLELGLHGIVVSYEVDAGEAQGIVLSEHPAREYVQGGKGDGTNGGALPEIGVGAVFQYMLSEDSLFSLKGGINYFKFDGDTDWLGIKSRNVKKIDLEYISFGLSATYSRTLTKEMDFFVGLSYDYFTADAYVQADENQTEEEILAKREKFDKDIDLDYSIITFDIGINF